MAHAHRRTTRRLLALLLAAAVLTSTAACTSSADRSGSRATSGGISGGTSGSTSGSTSSGTSGATTGTNATVVHTVVPPIGEVETPFARPVTNGTHVPVPSGTLSADGKTRTAQTFTGVPTVGPLYLVTAHIAAIPICTASVVHSTSGDVILTAAHCVQGGGILPGYHDALAFIPGYHDGQAPYGVWETTGAFLDSRWTASGDQDTDAAFLTVSRVGGGSQTLESLTGANTVRTDPPYTDPVTVLAYPMGAQKPIACTAPTSKFSDTQLRFACGGYENGSSGAPFLDAPDPATGTGTLIGVLGGYQQGGNSPDVSYASYPGADFAALYHAASGIG